MVLAVDSASASVVQQLKQIFQYISKSSSFSLQTRLRG